MFALLRRTFRRKKPFNYKSSFPESIDHIRAPPKTKKSFRAIIQLLDDRTITIDIPKKALGLYVETKINQFIDIFDAENSYFGLQFTDHNNIRHWLDSSKQVRKQVDVGPPYTLHFRVRFYPSDPMELKDEYTIYQVFLQVKQDMLSKARLGNAPLSVASEMSALSLQSELGDYIKTEHTPYLISQFHFLPEDRQTEEFELEVLDNFKKLSGQKPSQVERKFLNQARWLEFYGCDLHEVISKKKLENCYKFGLQPHGILLYEIPNSANSSNSKSFETSKIIHDTENMEKVGLFPWKDIKRLDFKRKNIYLDMIAPKKNLNDPEKIYNFVFHTHSPKHTKHLWKSAISTHQFYKLSHVSNQQQDQNNKFIRTKSTFSYKGKTENQIKSTNSSNFRRGDSRRSEFTRRSSKRYKGRASFHAGAGVSRKEYLHNLNQNLNQSNNTNTDKIHVYQNIPRPANTGNRGNAPVDSYSSKGTLPARSIGEVRSNSKSSLKEAFKIAI